MQGRCQVKGWVDSGVDSGVDSEVGQMYINGAGSGAVTPDMFNVQGAAVSGGLTAEEEAELAELEILYGG